MIYYFLHNGQADYWWLRSPWAGVDDSASYVYSGGNVGFGSLNHSYGRLALSEHLQQRQRCVSCVVGWCSSTTMTMWTIPTEDYSLSEDCPQRSCVQRDLGWLRRRRQLECELFLRSSFLSVYWNSRGLFSF